MVKRRLERIRQDVWSLGIELTDLVTIEKLDEETADARHLDRGNRD
jgi:hypothetical protein